MRFREGITATTWVTKDGRTVPVVKMSDRHLANAIRIIEQAATEAFAETPGIDPVTIAKALADAVPCFPLMLKERKRRGLA